jgi:hypothetical protein
MGELPEQGLIVVDGNFSTSGAGKFTPGPHGVTIVARGQVQFSGNEVNLGNNYIPDLSDAESGIGLSVFSEYGRPDPMPSDLSNLPGSNRCHSAGIQTPTSKMNWRGLIYAPYSLVRLPMSTSSTQYGQIIAYSANIHVSSGSYHFENDFLPTGPSQVGIVK